MCWYYSHFYKLLLAFIFTSCLVMTMTACNQLQPYRPTVEQGNILTPAMIDQLKIGMTKDEVINILGSPLLNAFINDPNEIHYLYTIQSNKKPAQHRNLTLYFKDDKLISIKRN